MVEITEATDQPLIQLLTYCIAAGTPLRIAFQRKGTPLLVREGRISWTASSDRQHPWFVNIGTKDDPMRGMADVTDILRVQEAGDDGVVLWERVPNLTAV
jgi:hypothetical protein